MHINDVRDPADLRSLRPPRRTVVAAALRATGTMVATIALYYVLPLDGRLSGPAGAWLALVLVGFIALGVSQVRGILHSRYPAVRAAEVLALLVPLFIVAFATYYYVAARHDPSSFSSPLDRTDCIYFTVTVLSTVGFGDITARSDGARIAVTLQMVGDLVIFTVLIRGVLKAVAHGWERKRADIDTAMRSASFPVPPAPPQRQQQEPAARPRRGPAHK